MHAQLLILGAFLFTTLSSVSALPVSFSNQDLVSRDLPVDNIDVYARELFDARDFDEADYELVARDELEDDLLRRDIIGDLEARGAFISKVAGSVAGMLKRTPPPDPKKVAGIANNIVKAQGQKAEAASKKKNLNAKTKAQGEGAYQRLDSTKTKDKATKKKEAKAAGDRAVTQAQKNRKTAKTAKWDAQKKTPEQKAAKKAEQTKNRADRKAGKPDAKPAGPAKTPSKKTKITPDEKKAAAKHLKDSAERMKNTENIPGRKDSFTVSNAKSATDKSTKEIMGKDVRKAVMMSNVNSPNPVGQPGKEQPKQYNNDPYSTTHPDPKLAGKPTIPGLPAGKGVEYPVLSGSNAGWTGDQKVGTARVITEKGAGKGGNDKFHGVIAHDQTKGGEAHDHYLATKNTAK